MEGCGRMKRGLHRLGLAGLTMFAIVAIIAIVSPGIGDIIGIVFFTIGVLWYALCRATAWIIEGFSNP